MTRRKGLTIEPTADAADLEQIAISPEQFETWSRLIRAKTLEDHGLTLDRTAAAREDGRSVYTFPREKTDAVLADYLVSQQERHSQSTTG